MPQVPYQPYSTAEPSSGGERLQVSAPPAAFGVNIGAALQGLGSTTEQVGNELFSRAMALQDLRNETDARDAQTQYAEKASMLHAQYGALEGKAATDGLKDYIKAQDDARMEFRGSLKTAFAQRFYDRDTLPFMQRNIFSAAGHAADENKRNVIGTAQAQKDITAKTFVEPKNEDEFQHKLETVDDADATIIAAKGLAPDSPQAADLRMQSHSKLWLGRIGQVAHDDPQSALVMLDNAKAKGEMTQDDFEKALLISRAQNRAIGGVNLVNSIFSADKNAGQMEDEVKEKAASLAHGDPLFEKDALAQLKGKIVNDRYIANQDKNAGIQQVFEGIQKGVSDIRELRLMPGMAATIDALPPSDREKIPAQINAYNSARDKKGQEENFTALTGMFYNDREGFLDADFSKYNLSQPQIRELMSKRAQAVKNPVDDPMLNRAMSWMRQSRAAELRALGIYFRPTAGSDATDYDHYTGAMQSAIDVWRQEKGKPPGFKDIVDEIGPSVIRQRAAPSAIFGMAWPTKKAMFDQDLTAAKKWADEKGLAAEITARGGSEPTEEEIYRAFVRSQFIDLYSKESGSGRPSVSQSK